MKILITENQHIELLEEEISSKLTNKKDNKWIYYNFEKSNKASWFDHRPEILKDYPKDFLNHQINMTIHYYQNKYDVRKVIVTDNEEEVGFLIYSTTTEKNEGISEDDSVVYPIILSTAIHPNYRQRGLLKMMINKAKITKPFITHTSYLTTPMVWEKIGCYPAKDLGDGNKIEMCK